MVASLLDKLLRAALVGGAVFDLTVGLLVFIAPDWLITIIKLPLPPQAYIWFLGVLQIGLSLAYVVGCISPVRHLGNVILAAVMRFAMSIVLINIGRTMALPLFTLLAVAEILLGLSHTVYAMRLKTQSAGFEIN